jgi:hypothetical protein
MKKSKKVAEIMANTETLLTEIEGLDIVEQYKEMLKSTDMLTVCETHIYRGDEEFKCYVEPLDGTAIVFQIFEGNDVATEIGSFKIGE